MCESSDAGNSDMPGNCEVHLLSVGKSSWLKERKKLYAEVT